MKEYKKFIIAFIVTVLLVVTIVQPMCFLMNLGVRCSDELYLYNWLHIKEKYSDSVNNKLLILSGSNTLFGVDAKRMEGELGYPVLNGGTHAVLHEYIFEWGKNILKEGDVVLLPLEFSFYSKNEYGEEYIKYIMCYDKDYFRKLPLWSKINLIYKSDLLDLVRLRLKSLLQDVHERISAYNSNYLNMNGDITSNWKKNEKPKEELSLEIAEDVFKVDILLEESVEELTAFIAWCRDNSVSVYATWPAYLYNDTEFHGEDLRAIEAIREFYAGVGVKVLGDYTDSLYDIQYFYDTIYHLNDEGKKIRTDYLIELIRNEKISVN